MPVLYTLPTFPPYWYIACVYLSIHLVFGREDTEYICSVRMGSICPVDHRLCIKNNIRPVDQWDYGTPNLSNFYGTPNLPKFYWNAKPSKIRHFAIDMTML